MCIVAFGQEAANLRSIRTSMRIIVRCNLHEGNAESFPALKRLMEDIAREGGTEIRVSPAAVRPTPTSAARGDATATLSFELIARLLALASGLLGTLAR